MDDVPMLEEEIGTFICEQLYKNNLHLENLDISNIKDEDHKDNTKICNIFFNIVKKGIEFNEDKPSTCIYLYYSYQAIQMYTSNPKLMDDYMFDIDEDEKSLFYEDMDQ